MNKNLRIVLVVFILVLTPVFWQSCTGALTPEDITARAHWTMNAVGSYHMASHYSASANNTNIVDESYIDVDFSVPDNYRVTLKDSVVGSETILAIGDEYYAAIDSMFIDINGNLSASAYPVIQSMKRESIFNYLGFLKDFDVLPNEDIDGNDCHHFSAAWDKEKQLKYYSDIIQQQRTDEGLPELSEEELAEYLEYLSDMLEEVTIECEIWIDKGTPYIRKMTLKQKQSMASEGGTIEYVTDATMDFSMINESIAVRPPLDEDGYLQAGWRQTTYEP